MEGGVPGQLSFLAGELDENSDSGARSAGILCLWVWSKPRTWISDQYPGDFTLSLTLIVSALGMKLLAKETGG